MKRIARISAPAKAILCGQHAVVYEQDAIAFGVDLKCYGDLYVKKQENQTQGNIKINIKLENQTKIASFNTQTFSKIESLIQIKEKQILEQHSQNQVDIPFESFCQKVSSQTQIDKIVLTTLYKIALFCGMHGLDSNKLKNILKNQTFIVQTYSQIPIGKGLGSSASFNSVLASALMLIFDIFKPNDDLQAYKSIINHISKFFEKVQHGRPSGIDNFVSIYGNMVLFNRSKNPPFKLIDNQKILHYLSQNLSIAFVDSEVEKNTKLAVSNVREKYDLHLQGNSSYKQMIEEIGTFPTKIIDILISQIITDQERKTKLFNILSLNHQYLKDLGLSNKEIEQIVSRYNVERKSVAKITGAGMGGVVLIVGEKTFLEEMKLKQKQPFFLSKMNTDGLQISFQQ